MTKQPLLNAGAAALYIVAVVSFMFYMDPDHIEIPTILVPIVMLSTLVLSVLVLSYIFFLKPGQMYLDGDKNAAVKLFVQNVAAFAAITVALIVAVLVLY